MNGTYVPPYIPPDDFYWQQLLEEGPICSGQAPGPWAWVEAPEVAPALWEEARRLQEARVLLELPIDGFNRGGLIAHWKGVECFVPASHLIAYPFPADPAARESRFQQYVGCNMRLCIIEVEPTRNRILLSEKQALECQPSSAAPWPDWLQPGAICKGRVTSVCTFGAFVDLGPLEGLIHISEISWGRVRHPCDHLKPGEEVQVMVLEVNCDHQRVSLSLKKLCRNPWDTVDSHLKPGDVVTGKIASIERFGLFVELLNGLEGLLHVSELPTNIDLTSLSRLYRVGQEMMVQVREIVPGEHRIVLSLPERSQPYATA